MKVTCVIPACNEGKTIRNLLRKLKKINAIKEIIVVDDGSNDNTYREARSENVVVLQHKKNKGKGAAIKTGIKKSSFGTLLFLDADIVRIDPKRIENMIEMSNKSDVVIGYFYFSCFQTFTEVVYTPLMKLLFPEVVEYIKKGFLSGQRIIKKSLIRKINLRDDFGFETGMNIELAFMKAKISYADLGKIEIRKKGFQKSMSSVAETILYYAKKHKRLKRLKDSSFKKAVESLYQSI